MKTVVTAFKEHKEFKRVKYWDANDLFFTCDAYSPPHYADTVEILVNRGAVGDMYICGNHYELSGEQVFYIPPNGVHSTKYVKNDGMMTVLKINVVSLKPLLDLEAILREEGIALTELPYLVESFPAGARLEKAFKDFSNLPRTLTEILAFFDALNSHTTHEKKAPLQPSANIEIANVIEWTEANFKKGISLSDAAEVFGYNKNYFCKKFKTFTGVTYLDYLNTLRISESCRLLRSGMSVSDTCEACGFTNNSYFIKLFKCKMGVTPKKYVKDNQ